MKAFKTVLDLLMGAVIPIVVLNQLSSDDRLGAIPAYIVSAMIPVAWVLIDLFFLTKRFNFITSYVGLSSILSGVLAFWFVDGVLFAVKDTIGFVFRAVLFAGSWYLGEPLIKAFLVQALSPDTPERERSLQELLAETGIVRSFRIATWILVIETVLAGIANFCLNLFIVVAPFGTETFNQQVAQVNAITRVALTIPTAIAFAIAMWLMYRAIYQELPTEEGKSQLDSEFWDLVQLREEAKQTDLVGTKTVLGV
jgi:hypothetical protein